MVNIRRVKSERHPSPRSFGSARAEVGEIDTGSPFRSVKAAVTLFGEVAVSKERRTTTPRNSTLSAENVIDKETQLHLAEKEINKIKQRLESTETTKAKADADLESAKTTLQDLGSKLRTVTKSKQSSIETKATEAAVKELQLQKSKNHQERDARKKELEYSRELYIAIATELDATKQELNKMRQDFDAASETKLAALQQAAEAQRSAKLHSERVNELSKEISVMKEAIKQVKFAIQQVYQEEENITAEKDALQKSFEEAQKKLMISSSSGKAYDPELSKYLEGKLMETTAEVEVLQEEMKKVHALGMDSVRVVTAELNEATTTLQLVADEECCLRKFVSSIRLELEAMKRKQQYLQTSTEMMDKEAERECVAAVAEEQLQSTNEHNFRLQQLLSEIENATSGVEEMKIEAGAAETAAKVVKQKLELALELAEEAKAAEKKALDEMQVLCGKGNIGNLRISREEFECLKRKVGESGNMSERKKAAAMAEVEAINARKSEIDRKLEASLKAIEEIKAATEVAVIEGELRRWCLEEQMLAS